MGPIGPIEPRRSPGQRRARAVHGFTDDELAAAPCWAEVASRFLTAAGARRILAYNAAFDSSALAATQQHAGLDATQLPSGGCWGGLGGGHRALGDAHDARSVLQAIAAPPR